MRGVLNDTGWEKPHVNGGGDKALGTCPPPQSEELGDQMFCTYTYWHICEQLCVALK